MKSYTNIEQSKTLAEILPIESSDMYYQPYPNDEDWYDVPNIGNADLRYNQLPCWSLAALLGVVSEEVGLNSFKDGNWNAAIMQQNGKMLYADKDNPVDACVGLIIKLHEQKLL